MLKKHFRKDLLPKETSVLADARMRADPVADDYITALMSDRSFHPDQFRDIAALAERHPLPTELANMVTDPVVLPPWADHGKLLRAQRYYEHHSVPYGFVLLIYSLPLMYAWGTGGAQTLAMNQNLFLDYRKRVHYTLEFLNAVFSHGGFDAGGKAGTAILRVRLIHAFARVMARKTDHWQEQWGAPVNQEKIMATALSFSLIAVQGLRRLGWRVKAEDEDALLHFWRVVARLLGADEIFVQFDVKHADRIWDECAKGHFSRTEAGVQLIHAHYRFIGSLTSPTTAGILCTLTEILVGENIAEHLSLPKSHRMHAWFWRGLIATRKASGALALPSSMYMPKLEELAKLLHRKIAHHEPATPRHI